MAELADAERQRLGRELHDSVGQQCTATSMLVAALKQQLGKLPKYADILRQLRLITKGLFPVDLDANGLRIALEDLADEIRRAHDTACRFECPAPILLQDNYVATQLYLIVREAVHNAVKHARATQIVIQVEESEGLCVVIRDDGIGFSSAALSQSTGMGLRIMRHRCDLIGAQLQFDSNDAGGTVVLVISQRAHLARPHNAQVSRHARHQAGRRITEGER
jgi:signal transduction histidine kinase